MALELDPSVALAVSVQARKGVYALILGSGISSASGIPTGWGIVKHLILKIAAAMDEGDAARDDPEAWYREKFRREPSYSAILATLGQRHGDRANIVRPYFESSEDDLESGEKRPTSAHLAIAQLVASRYIRVIVTTNFDKLLEDAIALEGVTPTVISTEEGAARAFTIAHDPCTVIKINGDYLDPHIRNTEDELRSYPAGLTALLGRIVAEYGLIVCGWSADWDHALRDVITAAESNPYGVYWTTTSAIKGTAKELAEAVAAVPLKIVDADQFFDRLNEDVVAMESLPAPAQLNSKIVVERVKRYIADPTQRIRLRGLVMDEVDRVLAIIRNGPPEHLQDGKDVQACLRYYEEASAPLRSMFAVGCYYATDEQVDLWVQALTRLANHEMYGGNFPWYKLGSYPAFLCLFSGGIAAIAAERYDVAFKLLLGTEVQILNSLETEPVLFALSSYRALSADILNRVEGYERSTFPQPFYLFDGNPQLWDGVKSLHLDDREFAIVLDRFEFLFALEATNRSNDYGPIGRFCFRRTFNMPSPDMWMESERRARSNEWPVLRAGFFGEHIDNVQAIWEKWQSYRARLGVYR